jgi:hypothetical protein
MSKCGRLFLPSVSFRVFRGQLSIPFVYFVVATISVVFATPELSIPARSALAGSNVVVELRARGVDQPCAGFNATIALPSDVTCPASARGPLTATDGYWHVRRGGTGTVSVVVWSALEAFRANRGVAFEFALAVASNAVPGRHPLGFTPGRTALSNADGAATLPHAVSNGWLTIDVDTDRDGCGDNWERDQFGSLVVASAQSDFDGDGVLDSREFTRGTDPKLTDTDGDGMTDAQELVAGTDPTDAGDRLAVERIVAEAGGEGDVTIEWESVPAHKYIVYESTDPMGVWSNVFQVWGDGTTLQFSTTNQGVRYLRVRVRE